MLHTVVALYCILLWHSQCTAHCYRTVIVLHTLWHISIGSKKGRVVWLILEKHHPRLQRFGNLIVCLLHCVLYLIKILVHADK